MLALLKLGVVDSVVVVCCCECPVFGESSRCAVVVLGEVLWMVSALGFWWADPVAGIGAGGVDGGVGDGVRFVDSSSCPVSVCLLCCAVLWCGAGSCSRLCVLHWASPVRVHELRCCVTCCVWCGWDGCPECPWGTPWGCGGDGWVICEGWGVSSPGGCCSRCVVYLMVWEFPLAVGGLSLDAPDAVIWSVQSPRAFSVGTSKARGRAWCLVRAHTYTVLIINMRVVQMSTPVKPLFICASR